MQASEPRDPRAFWIGVLVMLAFAGAGFGGGWWAIDRILLERALDDRGVVARGVVTGKEMIHSNTSPDAEEGTAYEVSYRFPVEGGEVAGMARVDSERFFSVDRGDPLDVRYLPDDPAESLPAGSRMSGLYWLFAGLGVLVGLGASIVLVGMTVARVRRWVRGWMAPAGGRGRRR